MSDANAQTNSNKINQLMNANTTSNTSVDYNVENVLSNIEDLFKGNDKDKRKKANDFLLFFEKSQAAWDIAKDIMNIPNLKEEAYYTATNIIKMKLRFDFGNYCGNKDIIISVGEFLIEKISTFRDKKFYILSNICRCFALFVVFAHRDIPDIIKVFVSKLNDQKIEGLTVILLVFTFLAEIQEDNNIVIDEDYRISYKNLLDNLSNDVLVYLDFMIKYSKENKEQFIKQDASYKNYFKNINKFIVECFNNWIKGIFPNDILSKLEKEYISIIDFIFDINDDNLDIYSECVCNLVKIPIEEIDNKFSLMIINRICSLYDRYKIIYLNKNRVYQAIKIQDENEIKFFIDIFIHLSENNMDVVIAQSNLEILNIILELTKVCPLSRLQLICDFWYALIIHKVQMISGDNEQKLEIIFYSVIKAFTKFSVFPNEIFLLLNKGETEEAEKIAECLDTIDYRSEIKEFLADSSQYLGFQNLYHNFIFPEIQKLIELIKLDKNNINAWANFEAFIFVISSISKSIAKDEKIDYINELINTLIQIPDDLQKIKMTFIDLIDNISSHLKINPEILIQIFKYLLINLENKALIENCSFSIKNILLQNSKIFIGLRLDLIKLYNENLKDKLLSDEIYENILEGFVYVLASNTNFEETKSDLVAIYYPWIFQMTEMKKLIEAKTVSKDQIDHLINCMDIVRIITRSTYNNIRPENKNIFQIIFVEVWDTIKFLFLNVKKTDLVNDLVHTMKYFMRGLGQNFKAYLPEYKEIILEGLNKKAFSAYIYAYENICSVFASDLTLVNDLIIFLKEIFLISFTKYLTDEDSFEYYQEITNDFFGLLFHLLKLNPIILFNLDILEDLISLIISKLGFIHIDSLKNLFYFLELFITFDKKQSSKLIDEKTKKFYFEEKVCKLIKKHGNEIIKNFITLTVYKTNKNLFTYLKDFVLILIEIFREDCIQWFGNCLQFIPSDCLTQSEQIKFINFIKSADTSGVKDSLKNFYKRCEIRYSRMRSFN